MVAPPVAAFCFCDDEDNDMASLIDRLWQRKQEAEVASAMTWDQLVADVVDGRTTDPDDILAALRVLGRQPDDLGVAVDQLTVRRKLQAVVAQESAVLAEIDDLDGRWRVAHDRYVRETARYEKECDGLRQRRGESGVDSRLAQIRAAKDQLSRLPTPSQLTDRQY